MDINSFISCNFKVYKSSSSFKEVADDLILYSFVIIMDEDDYIGLLTLAGVFKRPHSSLMDSLQEDIRIESYSNLRETLNLMEKKKLPVLPVFSGEKFAGVVIYTDLLKFCELSNQEQIKHLASYFDKSIIAEESLRVNQMVFKNAFDLHSSLMAITTVGEGVYIDVNKTFCSTLGFIREEIIGRSSVDLNIWESREARAEVLTLFQKQEYLTNHEVKYYTKNRIQRYGLFSIVNIEINGEKYLLTSLADITEQKKTELALRESEQIIRSLINIPNEHIVLLTPELIVLDINEQMLRSLGKKREDIIGHNSSEFIPSERLNQKKSAIDAIITTGNPVNHIYKRGDGWYSDIMFPISDESGKVLKIGVSSRDITELKKLEIELEQHRNHLEDVLEARSKELYESEKRYRDIINTITDYVYQVIIDSDNMIKMIHTEGCYNVTGYHSHEFINEPDLLLDLVFDADRKTVKEFLYNTVQGLEHEHKIEYRIVHKNGSIRWINNTIIIRRSADGKVIGYDGVIKDITEKKRTENEIKRLNHHIIKLQEEERQRVAQDLHDSVGQTILAAKINIEAYIQNPKRFKNQIDVGLSFLTQASNDLREIYTGLYPSVLNDLGLEMAIRLLISNSIESAGISAEVDISLSTNLPHDLNVNLYRIIQEIISNVLKHSQATSMYLRLITQSNRLTLTVRDNGTGFDPDIIHDGTACYGLANIKNRLDSYNGTITINENIPSGSNISISIELNSAS